MKLKPGQSVTVQNDGIYVNVPEGSGAVHLSYEDLEHFVEVMEKSNPHPPVVVAPDNPSDN